MGKNGSNNMEDGLWMAVLNADDSNFEDGACCASGKTRETWETLEFRSKFLLQCPSHVFPTGRPPCDGVLDCHNFAQQYYLQRLPPESEPMTASAGVLKAIRGMESNLLESETEKGWTQLMYPRREQCE